MPEIALRDPERYTQKLYWKIFELAQELIERSPDKDRTLWDHRARLEARHWRVKQSDKHTLYITIEKHDRNTETQYWLMDDTTYVFETSADNTLIVRREAHPEELAYIVQSLEMLIASLP